jgi:hypothetical protein
MSKKYEQYINVSFSGKTLLSKHRLDEDGLWKILGEDSNPDLGGTHYEPELGIVEGRLGDVIKYAVDLTGFWAWGSGGRIVKIETPIRITAESNAKRVEAQRKIQQLETLLEQARTELGKL